jgi:hypothetical protein
VNDHIIKLGLESGMLNYVDHETPRHYFLSAHADEECLEKFAELIVRECAGLCSIAAPGRDAEDIEEAILKHFGDKE